MTGRRIPAAAVLLAALCAGSGCAAAQRPASPPLGRYRAGGVTVTVALRRDGRAGRLAVTFTPERGFHLYSSTLDSRRAAGLGTATRVAVTGGLRAAGPATASEPVQPLRIASLHVTLPAYPDGPVTLSLPVWIGGPGRAGVVVSYGACSAATCLMPVIRHPIPLRLG